MNLTAHGATVTGISFISLLINSLIFLSVICRIPRTSLKKSAAYSTADISRSLSTGSEGWQHETENSFRVCQDSLFSIARKLVDDLSTKLGKSVDDSVEFDLIRRFGRRKELYLSTFRRRLWHSRSFGPAFCISPSKICHLPHFRTQAEKPLLP